MRNILTGQAMEEWEYRRGRKTVTVKTKGRLLVTEVGTMLGACLAGVGIARIKAIGVQELLDQGHLIDLFPDWPGEAYPLYALIPHVTCRRPRCAPSLISWWRRSSEEGDAAALQGTVKEKYRPRWSPSPVRMMPCGRPRR
ncbi:MAG: hypothetical protein ABWY00_17390 [Dongiaceae bacterium]